MPDLKVTPHLPISPPQGLSGNNLRDDGPVTGHEVLVRDGEGLVSAANTRGVITFCNTQAISKISTLTQEEVQSANQLSQEMVRLTEDQLQLMERFE